MDKIESSELVNLIFSIVFFVVLYKQLNKQSFEIPKFYVIGTILLLLGNFFTVFETFVFPVLFNSLEHITFTLGTVFFFIGSIKTYNTNGRTDN